MTMADKKGTSSGNGASGAGAADASPMNIATISAGFEKGDFLVREEQGNRVYFDFFEEVRRRRGEELSSFLIDSFIGSISASFLSGVCVCVCVCCVLPGRSVSGLVR